MRAKIRRAWSKSTIGRSVSVLPKRSQIRIFFVAIIQILLGSLDLLGVALIGILGALAVNGVQSRPAGDRVDTILSFLGIADKNFQTQAAILGVLATLTLVGRTVFSIIFTRKILFFLSRQGAHISGMLISKLLSKNLMYVNRRSNQETLFAVTTGVSAITLGVLGISVSLISDVSILVVMGLGLFVVDPLIAFSTLIVFASIALVMYQLSQRRAQALGVENVKLSISSNETILEVLNSYRESVVRNRRSYYAHKIRTGRLELADVLAETAFLPNISKYVIETAVILGALFIAAIQFWLQDASHAVATLAVFIAAGTRIAPAVLRVQQGALGIRSSLGNAGPTLDLIEDLLDTEEGPTSTDLMDTKYLGFTPSISLVDVTFTYPGSVIPAISNINLEISEGKLIALVGPSGAGKTTLVDVLLGVLNPELGTVEISGCSPIVAFSQWPGAVSYVPQDVIISNGSIRQNVGFGYPTEVAQDKLVIDALEIAHLDYYVSELSSKLDTSVGERGTKLSGGQRQRLGIARAMFTKPQLLVLDEATSSLDGETEANISEAMQQLRGRTTVVMIAHRLSTVRHADLVVYMESGKVVATGNFDEVRKLVPNFDKQAQLMGL